jgi:hypothetical protein
VNVTARSAEQQLKNRNAANNFIGCVSTSGRSDQVGQQVDYA